MHGARAGTLAKASHLFGKQGRCGKRHHPLHEYALAFDEALGFILFEAVGHSSCLEHQTAGQSNGYGWGGGGGALGAENRAGSATTAFDC